MSVFRILSITNSLLPPVFASNKTFIFLPEFLYLNNCIIILAAFSPVFRILLISFSLPPVTFSSKFFTAGQSSSSTKHKNSLVPIKLSIGVSLIFALSSSSNSLFFILFNKSIILFVVSGASFLFSLLTVLFSIFLNKSVISSVVSCASFLFSLFSLTTVWLFSLLAELLNFL